MTTRQAINLKQNAQRLRVLAPSYDPIRADANHQQAALMDREAMALMTPPKPLKTGLGDEIIPAMSQGYPGLENALTSPDLLNLEATIQRTDLADKAGVFDLAIEAAESSNAHGSVQKMLCHQMAAAHKHALRLLGEASGELNADHACKKTLTAAQLIDAFSKAAVTLQRLQAGAGQVVTVERHLQVSWLRAD